MSGQIIRQYVDTVSLNAAKRSIIKIQLERNQRKLYKIKRKNKKKTTANATLRSQQDRPKFCRPKPILEGMSRCAVLHNVKSKNSIAAI